MKKNIAIFEPNLNIGGIEKSLINLLKKIDYDKYIIYFPKALYIMNFLKR